MKLRPVFVFSGQGSQYYQMGAALYQQGGAFRRYMDSMDAQLVALTGSSVLATLYGEHMKGQAFDDISLTTPAIYMVEYALAAALMEAGLMPAMTLGASHGAFAASAIAGCISMETGLLLAAQHGQVMRSAGADGGMIAILSNPDLFEGSDLHRHAVIAARHFAGHFVVSAQREHLPEIEKFLKSRSCAFQRLPVRYPFHSPWMDPVEQQILALSAALECRPARLPLACTAYAECITGLPADYFWQLVRQPIQFEKTITRLEQDGPYSYIDLGPSGSLATFLKYLLPQTSASQIFPLMTPYGRDLANFNAVLA